MNERKMNLISFLYDGGRTKYEMESKSESWEGNRSFAFFPLPLSEKTVPLGYVEKSFYAY
jgi:hypothetical protein